MEFRRANFNDFMLFQPSSLHLQWHGVIVREEGQEHLAMMRPIIDLHGQGNSYVHMYFRDTDNPPEWMFGKRFAVIHHYLNEYLYATFDVDPVHWRDINKGFPAKRLPRGYTTPRL